MKNVHETRGVKFINLLTEAEKALVKDDNEIPEPLAKLSEALGVTKATDVIEFSTSVGSIMFDIYNATTEVPKAPLAAEKELINRQSLAKQMLSDEFELTDELKTKVEKALNTDAIWSKIMISVSNKVGDETRYSQLSCGALNIFGECKKSLLGLFLA
jgi:hypothetical protein